MTTGNLGSERMLNRVIGARLRAARVAAGRTQADVALALSKAGYAGHQTKVSKMESGQPVSFAEAHILASALGLSVAALAVEVDPETGVPDLSADLDITEQRVAEAYERGRKDALREVTAAVRQIRSAE